MIETILIARWFQVALEQLPSLMTPSRNESPLHHYWDLPLAAAVCASPPDSAGCRPGTIAGTREA